VNGYRLIVGPFAELDLQVAYEWYDLKKEGLGKEFLKEIDFIIDRIRQNPKQFGKIKKQIRMAVVKRFPFGVFFVQKEDLINIIAVLHFSRNPKILRSRIK
jgi:hypothetical protein